MYEKNLTKDVRVRLSERDFDFLSQLSADRAQSVSELLRYIVGEYRRSVQTMEMLNKALELSQKVGDGVDK